MSAIVRKSSSASTSAPSTHSIIPKVHRDILGPSVVLQWLLTGYSVLFTKRLFRLLLVFISAQYLPPITRLHRLVDLWLFCDHSQNEIVDRNASVGSSLVQILSPMPHSTSPPPSRPDRSSSRATPQKLANEMRTSMEKFPDIDTSFVGQPGDQVPGLQRFNGTLNGTPPIERWQSRREPLPSTWTGKNTSYNPSGRGHGRQKSLGDAFRTIRTRKGSVSENAHEIAHALKAPVSPKLIVGLPPSIILNSADNL